MSDVQVWRLFAYMDDDEAGANDESRSLAEWQVEGALRWCLTRGFDNVYLSRLNGKTTRFKRAAPAPVTHHMHLVTEGSRGSGDDAA